MQRCISHMAVPRKLDPNRWRRVADNNQPRSALYTLGQRERVQSLGAACGWSESKQILRDLRGPPMTWLRHSPALRRPHITSLSEFTASSKTPAEIRDMVAKGLLTLKIFCIHDEDLS